MPYTLKPNKLFAKDPNGDGYLPQNVVTDQSTTEQVALINSTGAAQVSAIQAKGAETLDSIPDDYTALQGEVDDLKSATSDINFGTNRTFSGFLSGRHNFFNVPIFKGGKYRFTNNTNKACTINGKKANGDQVLIVQPVNSGDSYTFVATEEYVQIGGYFNGTGSVTIEGLDTGLNRIPELNEIESEVELLKDTSFGINKQISVSKSTSASTYYPAFILKGLVYTVTNNTGATCAIFAKMEDGSSDTVIDGLTDGSSHTFTAQNDYVEIGGWFNAAGTITVAGGEIGTEINNLIKTSKMFMYMGNYGDIGLSRNMTNGRTIFTIYQPMNFIVLENRTTITISKSDILTQLSNYATASGDNVDVSIPSYCAWCYNIATGTMSMKFIYNVTETDYVIAYNGWGNPCGAIVEQYLLRKYESLQQQIESSAGDVKGTPYYDKMEAYAKLLYGDLKVQDSEAPTNFENFIWFTDPHTMYGDYTYDPSSRTYGCINFDKYISELEFVYNSTPTDFVLCGGDWNDGGLPAPEMFKLSRAMESCKSKLSPFYNCVGNHDTNYQGKATSESTAWSSRLSPECLKDLWYRDQEKCYYTFNGKNTKFYVFDTRIENGLEDTTYEATYLKNQLKWFANALQSDNTAHIALAMHIYYYTGTTIDGFADYAMKIACSYNARATYTYDGTEYDFSSATGKIEFALVGHSHADFETSYEYANEEIPVIGTINAGNATGSPSSYVGAEHCVFDLVHINYDAGERKIKLIRIGALGEDRTVNLPS